MTAPRTIQRVSEVTDTEEAATRAQVDRLAEEVARLRAAIDGSEAHRGGEPARS